MTVSAQQVKELREKTGVGMMDCKKALAEAGGDLDQAFEVLRKQGLKSASKKAERIAAEGITAIDLDSAANVGVILEINCETDFVAKNDDFVKFANALTRLISQKNPKTVDEVLALSLAGAETVNDQINMLIAKIGEKISLRRFERVVTAPSEKLGSYIHLGSKIGVLVRLKGKNIPDIVVKDLAMHIAASQPRYLKKENIPAEVIAKEKEIYKEQMKDSGKPANVLEKIIEGKISKFASEVCLEDQIFIKDPTGKKSIRQVLKEIDPSLEVISFTRFQVGEGIEKKKEDFAAEVAKIVQ